MTDRPSDLKPCPFCGCDDIARANNTYGAHWTMCNGCGAQTGEVGISSQAEADSRWNMRAAPPPTKPPEIGSKSVAEPTAEHWRRAIEEWEGRMLPSPRKLKEICDDIEQRARQMAKAGGDRG